MLSSTIDYLRRTISEHPGYPALEPRLHGYTVHNCTTKQLKWLAMQLNISYRDDDRRGRPRKDPFSVTPAPITIEPPQSPSKEEPMTQSPVSVTPAPVGSLEQIIRDIIRDEASKTGQIINETHIKKLIEEYSSPVIQKPISVTLADPTKAQITLPAGTYHYKLPLVLAAVNAGLNVMLVGPAGSGKSHMCEQIASILNLPYYFSGAVQSEFKLLGFRDANGVYHETAFYKAYKHGGVFNFDEIDASSAQAILAFNAPLSNGHGDFPVGIVDRHPDFRVIASANTYGTGQSRTYVGRNQLDAASINRFVQIEMDYDPVLEASLVGANITDPNRTYNIVPRDCDATMARVIYNRIASVRKTIEKLNIRHIVSPRNTLAYKKLYEAGWPIEEIEKSVIWQGLDKPTIDKIEANILSVQ